MADPCFISFEGPEGAGKSTQLQLLRGWLANRGREVVTTREPGGTPLGDRVREALFAGADSPPLPLAEALLMSAARAQHVGELLRPALASGKVVLCDRYADATLAYQGYGRGLDLHLLRGLVALATGGLKPNLTIYLDVPAEVGLRRKLGSGASGELNYLDHLALDFHQRVVDGYRALIRAEPSRFRVVDATQPAAAVQAAIRAIVAGVV